MRRNRSMNRDDRDSRGQVEDSKPWENQFEDERDDRGNYSRTANKRKNRNNTVLTTSLLIIFIVIILGTIGLYFLSQKTATKTVENDADSVEVVTSSEGKRKSSSTHKAKKATSKKEEKQATSTSAETTSSKSEASSSEVSSSSSVVSSSSAASSSSQEAKQYATVGQGQGIYRVATNNGLTVDQLIQLNPGLSTSSQLSPGQQVRIK